MKGWITFVVNGQDIAPVLSTYKVNHLREYDTEITTMNGREHKYGEGTRTEIVFSVLPRPMHHTIDARALRRRPLIVKYSDPDEGIVREQEFNDVSDGAFKFLLHNIFGDDMYRRGEITFRAVDRDDYI